MGQRVVKLFLFCTKALYERGSVSISHNNRIVMLVACQAGGTEIGYLIRHSRSFPKKINSNINHAQRAIGRLTPSEHNKNKAHSKKYGGQHTSRRAR